MTGKRWEGYPPTEVDHDCSGPRGDDSAEADKYLRMLVERVLVNELRRNSGGDYAPVAAAAALVAVGAIKRELAQDVLIDFGLACWLRRGRGPGVDRARTQALPNGPGKAPKPPRVVPCRAEFDLPWGKGHVRYVLFSEDVTTIGISSTGNLARSGRPPDVRVSVFDDQGTTVTAIFGGMFVPGISGVLTCDRPLHCRTRWIDFGDTRIDLPEADQVAPEVRLEQLSQTDPALAHLWRRLATAEGAMPVSDIEAAIEALVAVGAVDADSAELNQVRNVAATMRVGWRTLTFQGWAGQPANSSVPLPEPWHSLAATRRKVSGQGPIGVLGVGAVTPPVDGTVVVVEALVTYPNAFTVHVTTTPATTSLGSAPARPIFYSPGNPLAWFAEDDRGGVYLGGPSHWGGGPDYSRGIIEFSPGLDARCRALRIVPTGQTQRAVIPINLRWDEER